jgi:hypothetical protein
VVLVLRLDILEALLFKLLLSHGSFHFLGLESLLFIVEVEGNVSVSKLDIGTASEVFSGCASMVIHQYVACLVHHLDYLNVVIYSSNTQESGFF